MNSKRLRNIGIGFFIVFTIAALLYLLRGALTPVFMALLLAYLLDPLIDRMEKRKLNRSVSILIFGGAVILVVCVVGGTLMVLVQRELMELFQNLPQYFEKVQTKLVPLLHNYLGIELPRSMGGAIEEVKSQLDQLDPSALKPVTAVVSKITSSTLAFVSWIVGLIIIPVFLFYFLRDWDLLTKEAAKYIPKAHREYLVDKFKKIDEVLGAFIRGQLTICAILGVLYSVGLLIVGVDMAVVIGMFSGMAFIVPYLGTVVGVVAASIMALLEFGVSYQLLGVLVVFGVVQGLEGILITPKIMGDQVGLSPVMVIISLLVGAELLGLLGLLVAVPAAAVLNVFFMDVIEKYRESSFFLGESDKDESGS